MCVAVGEGIAQDGVVFANAYKVHAPGVNTDARYLHTTAGSHLQPLHNLVVQGIDVPIEVPTRFYQVVRKTSQFFQLALALIQASEYRPATCRAQVGSKKVFHGFFCKNETFRFSAGKGMDKKPKE